MIRALIVDDSPLVRQGIRLLLRDEDDIDVVGEAVDGPDAVAVIQALSPDLVFLDVQMPGLDGFEVLDRASQVHLAAVIFVTAYDQYALRAFEANAIGYLLKPFTPERFRETVKRARQLLAHEEELANAHRRVAELIPHGVARARELKSGTPSAYLSRLAVKDRERFVLLKADEVDWITAAGDYVQLHARGRLFLFRMTMHELEQKLDPKLFRRIHRSAIVNLDRVREVKPLAQGDFDVLLEDGKVLRMSRSYREQLF